MKVLQERIALVREMLLVIDSLIEPSDDASSHALSDSAHASPASSG